MSSSTWKEAIDAALALREKEEREANARAQEEATTQARIEQKIQEKAEREAALSNQYEAAIQRVGEELEQFLSSSEGKTALQLLSTCGETIRFGFMPHAEGKYSWWCIDGDGLVEWRGDFETKQEKPSRWDPFKFVEKACYRFAQKLVYPDRIMPILHSELNRIAQEQLGSLEEGA